MVQFIFHKDCSDHMKDEVTQAEKIASKIILTMVDQKVAPGTMMMTFAIGLLQSMSGHKLPDESVERFLSFIRDNVKLNRKNTLDAVEEFYKDKSD